MAKRVIRNVKVVECDTLAEANSHVREEGEIFYTDSNFP